MVENLFELRAVRLLVRALLLLCDLLRERNSLLIERGFPAERLRLLLRRGFRFGVGSKVIHLLFVQVLPAEPRG